jgi:Ca2+-binding RTX toxin-like protein
MTKAAIGRTARANERAGKKFVGTRRALLFAAVAVMTVASAVAVPTLALASNPGANGRIAFHAPSGAIKVMNLDGSSIHTVAASGNHPAWSPSGSVIAYEAYSNGAERIFTVRPDGTGRRTLVPGSYPTFSPDGTHIAFVPPAGGISVISLASRYVQNIRATGWDPDWSAQNVIAFTDIDMPTTGGSGVIFTVNPDGSGATNLGCNTLDCGGASWSPDGTHILVDYHGDQVDGDGLTWVDPKGVWGPLYVRDSDRDGAYSPDGTAVVFSGGYLHHSGYLSFASAALGSGYHTTNVKGDQPAWAPIPCTITGTDGNDTIKGTAGGDIICGLSGDDTIYGNDGNDTVIGGAGKDIIHGGAGADLVVGDGWSDQLYGDGGNDRLNSTDTIRGNDTINGGTGTDSCVGDQDDAKVSCP